jgi:hypothetical protein
MESDFLMEESVESFLPRDLKKYAPLAIVVEAKSIQRGIYDCKKNIIIKKERAVTAIIAGGGEYPLRPVDPVAEQ